MKAKNRQKKYIHRREREYHTQEGAKSRDRNKKSVKYAMERNRERKIENTTKRE